jgi:large subunit ribosomal protein L18
LSASKSHYKVRFRRRRQGKTDFYQRKAFIISRKKRLVVRRSNKHIRAQIIEAHMRGDSVLVAADSGELTRFGWNANCSNTPAAYLVGLIIGGKALINGIKEAVLDIGLYQPSRGSRVFAVLKGALDAGLSIPNNEIILPEDERLTGEHIALYCDKLNLEEVESTKHVFSKYRSQNISSKNIVKHFEEVKSKIINYNKEGIS